MMKTALLLLIVVISCVCTAVLPSGAMLTDPPACANYENAFHWEGRGYTESEPEDIAVTETHIYIASLWLGLEIVDWTDPADPTLVSQVRVVEEGSGLTIRSVAVGGSLAVVKQGGSPTPLFVIDVTDPENPVLEGSLEIEGGSSLAVAEAGYVYAESDEGIQVIDATDAAAPVVSHVVPLAGGGGTLVIRGGYLYSSTQSGLTVLDLQNPSQPVVVADLSYGINLNGPFDVRGRYACQFARFGPNTDSAVLVDVSVPEAPVLVGEFSVGFPSPPEDVVIQAPYIYTTSAWHEAISIIDISDISSPVLRMNMEPNYNMYRDIEACGSHVFTVVGSSVDVFDAGESPLVDPLAHVATPEPANAVAVDGRYAYVVGTGDSGEIIDLQAPGGPAIVASLPASGPTRHIVRDGDILYVGNWLDGFSVVDISTPTAPVQLVFVDLENGSEALTVSGDLLYVASSTEITAYDVTAPGAPAVVGTYTALGPIRDLEVVDGVLYLVARSSVEIVDVADPRGMFQLSAVELPTFVYGLTVRDGLVYVANWWAGLTIVDASDPEAPHIIGNQDTPNYGYDVTLSGDLAYVADNSAGVQIIDVADPTKPFLIGRAGFLELRDPDDSYSMLQRSLMSAVSDGVLYMPLQGGLQLLPVQCGGDGAITVDLDIRPGSGTDPVNCRARGVLQVAILSTEGFDARDVDHTTVVFGPGQAREARANRHRVLRQERDVDHDGDKDLVFHFRLAEAELDCAAGTAELAGETFDGREIRGVASFKPVPPQRGRQDAKLALGAWPNPFNPSVTISFALSAPAAVDMRIYDLSGRLVRTLAAGDVVPAGNRQFVWNGRDDHGRAAAAGVYFCRLRALGSEQGIRVMLVK